jgi:hypothetical protein
MKAALIITLNLLFSIGVLSQTGTPASPFTSLGNARTVTTPGIYYFDLGGVQFSSYVNSTGLVLVATDAAGSAAGSLPQVTALTNSGRGILSPAVLATLTSATTAAITTSNGELNSSTSNPSLISRITNNSSLHTGSTDLSINSGWTGTGASRLRGAAATCNTGAGDLNNKIYHPCGDQTSLHWIPLGGTHRVIYNAGESSAGVRFNLWVGAVLVPLPVTLSEFNAVASANNTVNLSWTTQTEVNSDYFIVQRSSDGTQWTQVGKVDAQNNSNRPTAYSTIDKLPGTGINFYRLQIVDLDGSMEYSKIVRATTLPISSAKLTVYPNPGRNKIHIELDQRGEVKIFTNSGIDVTRKIRLSKVDDQHYTADFSKEPKGVYIIKTANGSTKLVVE